VARSADCCAFAAACALTVSPALSLRPYILFIFAAPKSNAYGLSRRPYKFLYFADPLLVQNSFARSLSLSLLSSAAFAFAKVCHFFVLFLPFEHFFPILPVFVSVSACVCVCLHRYVPSNPSISRKQFPTIYEWKLMVAPPYFGGVNRKRRKEEASFGWLKTEKDFRSYQKV